MNISRLRRRSAAYRFWGILIRFSTILSFLVTGALMFIPLLFGSTLLTMGVSELAQPGSIDAMATSDAAANQAFAVSLAITAALLCVNLLPHSLFWFLSVFLIGKADDLLDQIDLAQAVRKRKPQPVYDEDWEDQPEPPLRRRRFEDPPERRERFVYDRDFDD